MKTVGDRIRFVRQKLGLTVEEFGKRLNVAKGSVSNWENNNRTPDTSTLVAIANLGEVTTDFLLCRTDDPEVKVYSANMNGKDIDIGISKSYPHDLTPEEVNALIRNLNDAGFDINKLIEKVKREP